MNSSERGRRGIALAVLAAMMVIFIVLSAFSFVRSRDQVTPETVRYASHEAVAGKRVFQAYNCMGCHTIVGNGAYFGPDLTDVYERAGPAWLTAFLPSASTWPTEAAVRTQLVSADVRAESGELDIAAYYDAYPGAKERVDRRGGGATFMPTLPITAEESGQLIAFLKYTSMMDTEGWPPEPKVDGLEHPWAARAANAAAPLAATEAARAAAGPSAAPAAAGGTEASAASAPADPVAEGAELVKSYGCVSCHATDDSRLVGPGWGGLYGSSAVLSDGSTVTVDDAYLEESILDPGAEVAEGYPAGVMPAYAGVISADELTDIVAYIRSLEGAR